MFYQAFYSYILFRINQELLSVRLRKVPIANKEYKEPEGGNRIEEVSKALLFCNGKGYIKRNCNQLKEANKLN
ncbi:16937_t:CDS:2 [Gigaspora margarita]|uniref:16937_t:CDS:1 n=1 Tax=Gigaspora margarita TaxID=4874 RepID=A0ABN7UEJ5_GIGMA|nr:16937_t:CDS:2 [Gigaspora margarita]